MSKKSNAAENAEPIVEASESNAAENAEPIVEAGEYYKKVKVRFLGLICGDFGTFDKGDVGEIALYSARELEKAGKVEIVKE